MCIRDRFKGTIDKVVALAIYMPVVAGMGGNAATQTLTVIVRGIALGELTWSNTRKALLKEAAVAATNMLIIMAMARMPPSMGSLLKSQATRAPIAPHAVPL